MFFLQLRNFFAQNTTFVSFLVTFLLSFEKIDNFPFSSPKYFMNQVCYRNIMNGVRKPKILPIEWIMVHLNIPSSSRETAMEVWQLFSKLHEFCDIWGYNSKMADYFGLVILPNLLCLSRATTFQNISSLNVNLFKRKTQ